MGGQNDDAFEFLSLQQFKQKIKNYLMEDPIFNKSVCCLIHKNQKVTHLCHQLQCSSNPLLCRQCFIENIHLHYHSSHEGHLQPFNDSIVRLADTLKNHLSPLKKIYKSTVGKSEFAGILQHIEKGNIMFEELEDRINHIKSQVELQLDLLLKQFQKTLLLEKQEYFKILDNYQKTFIKNVQLLRNQTQSLIDYQQSLKYYANRNNLLLKTISQARKKSDWLIKSKRVMMNANKILQNSHFTNQTNNILSIANKLRLDLLPTWKGQQNIDKGNQFKYLIKRSLNQWVYVPEIKSVGEESENGKNYFSHNPFK